MREQADATKHGPLQATSRRKTTSFSFFFSRCCRNMRAPGAPLAWLQGHMTRHLAAAPRLREEASIRQASRQRGQRRGEERNCSSLAACDTSSLRRWAGNAAEAWSSTTGARCSSPSVGSRPPVASRSLAALIFTAWMPQGPQPLWGVDQGRGGVGGSAAWLTFPVSTSRQSRLLHLVPISTREASIHSLQGAQTMRRVRGKPRAEPSAAALASEDVAPAAPTTGRHPAAATHSANTLSKLLQSNSRSRAAAGSRSKPTACARARKAALRKETGGFEVRMALGAANCVLQAGRGRSRLARPGAAAT